MTNKEWLATLPKETWWEVVHEWLFYSYKKVGVLQWLEEKHFPIRNWDGSIKWE